MINYLLVCSACLLCSYIKAQTCVLIYLLILSFFIISLYTVKQKERYGKGTAILKHKKE